VVDFVVEKLEHVTLDIAQEDGLLAGHDLMSPYVWIRGEVCHLLVRVINNPLSPDDPTGLIYAGTSDDGLCFTMLGQPAIAPGPEPDDAGGCEDPTVVIADEGELLVYYTGVDAKRSQGCLMVARGTNLGDLRKERVLLKAPEGWGNIKEASVARCPDGTYRLLFEYAKDNASRIGIAIGSGPDGPWEVQARDPFTVRDKAWDNFHLSTGPIVLAEGRDPVMFYNGATADARWRIGWITFSPDFTEVTDRCIEPMLIPPPPVHRSGTDIAFAASCLTSPGCIQLYFSVEDRLLRRAQVKRYD
jgi:predicted GH43/DUF377 family glycosyl hydrolase